MVRALIIGSGGAGKSTFATQLATKTRLPLIHLDAHYWQPGWVEPDKTAWKQKVQQLASTPSWIIDGNYSNSMDIRMARADTVIFLDFKRWLCLYRVLKRYLQYRGKARPDMQPDCPERIDLEFIRFIWGFKNKQRPTIYQKLGTLEQNKQIIILKSPADVAAFLTGLQVI